MFTPLLFFNRLTMSTNERTMKIEQRINLNFLVRFKKIPSQVLDMLQQVYADKTLSHTHVFKWYKRFKERRKEVKIEFRIGRP